MPKRDATAAIAKAFGDAVRHQRTKLGLSQEQFALQHDFDRTYISGIERGVRNPTVQIVVRIAQALGVRPSTLFRRAEDSTGLWD